MSDMEIKDSDGTPLTIGMRVGCRKRGQPRDWSVRGLTLLGYEPGTEEPYITSEGRFALAVKDHQPDMENWIKDHVEPISPSATVKPGEFYERIEDMSPRSYLRVLMEEDGDMIITVVAIKEGPGRYRGLPDMDIASVQFCARAGGGRSPNVRKALQELALAIEKDNAERPIAL